MSNYIRFDWAMKRLLRDKGNFAVLEGLATTLFGGENYDSKVVGERKQSGKRNGFIS